jgi:hypothetical protein
MNRYDDTRLLAGIIYFHRISDPRMGGVSRTNLRMFRQLCGPESLQNVVIATTFWDKVDEEEGIAKINELKTNVNLFQPVVAAGGKIMRHDKRLTSAHSILDTILSNRPRPLLIQEEMAQGMNLQQTAVGLELNATLTRLIEAHQRLLRVRTCMAQEKELEEPRNKVAHFELEKKKIQDPLNTKAKRNKRHRLKRLLRRLPRRGNTRGKMLLSQSRHTEKKQKRAKTKTKREKPVHTEEKKEKQGFLARLITGKRSPDRRSTYPSYHGTVYSHGENPVMPVTPVSTDVGELQDEPFEYKRTPTFARKVVNILTGRRRTTI